jgi:uncharacterized membrane protein YheB (UPF0754 family)
MTPGVIPSQRARLADNMGEVVGDHLLTSIEIGKALQEEKFQQHLLNVIAERVGAILHADLPPLPELIPDKFSIYRDLGLKSLKQQLRDNINKFILSPAFEGKVREAIDDRVAHLLERKVEEVFGRNSREATYLFIETSMEKMFASATMANWLDGFIRQQVYEALQQEKSLNQLLPESLMFFLEESIREQTPNLLKKLAAIFQEPEVRDAIVRGACGGVDNFILSLGPMAPMVQNFISMEVVDQKIREYLDEKEEDISNWLSSEELQQKVGVILADRFANFASTPLVTIIDVGDAETVDDFCSHFARQLALVLQGPEVRNGLLTMIRENIETHLDHGNTKIGTALTDFLGSEGVDVARNWLRDESISLLRAPETLKTVGQMIDTLADTLLTKRVGKLSSLLPGDVRKEIYVSIQKLTSNMLAIEVPGLVASLDIRSIVADKINSLDLLRLERLLLSIMEEQFKYINLFGALLGFLLGCLNLLFLQLN